MNNGKFGIIVAGRIREGQEVVEMYPSGPDRKIYSAFLSKDNRLFILSATSKQELENLVKIRVGPLYYLHIITATFGFLYPVIQLSCHPHSLTRFTLATSIAQYIHFTHH